MADPVFEEDKGAAPARSLRVPHMPDAEIAVLGMLFNNNAIFDEIEVPLQVEDFYAERHQLIFSHIARLRNVQGKVADVVTVARGLNDAGKLQFVGGTEYLGDLAQSGEISTNFAEYAHILREMRSLRKLLEVTSIIRERVHEPHEQSAVEILDYAESKIFELVDDFKNLRSSSMAPVADLVDKVDIEVNRLYERVSKGLLPYTGVVTGYTKFDEYTSGLQPGELILLAARPSVGKTSFALDMVRNICNHPDEDGVERAVVFFSLEMSSQQLALRLVSKQSEVDQYKLRTGKIHEQRHWKSFRHALDKLKNWPLWIDETTLLDVNVMRSLSRRVMREAENHGKKLSLVVVDYLQLMCGTPEQARESRNLEVSAISRSLKSLARELKVPVLALSQLSRKPETGQRHPILSDLRDSGSLEQDADLIVFLHRQGEMIEGKVPVQLTIGKNRNGPVGSCNMLFLPSTTSFEEVLNDYYGPSAVGGGGEDAQEHTFSA